MRRARRAAALAGLATAAFGFAAAGRAGAAPPGPRDLARALADADAGEAAIVVRLDAGALEPLVGAALARVPFFARGAVGAARAQVVAAVGADPTTAAGLASLGLDPARPAIAAFGAADVGGVLGALHATGPLLPGGHAPRGAATGVAVHPVWRARLVLPVADRRRARAAVRRWAAALPGHADLAPGPALARRGVVADVALPGAAAFARTAPRALILDVVVDGDDAAATPARLARYLDARTPVRSAALAAPAAAALATPGVTVWLDPVRLGEALLVGEGPSLLPRLEVRCGLTCTDLAGPLGPLAIALGARGQVLTVDATWQVAAGSPLAAALARTADHALLRPDDAPDADLVARSYVASWWPLARLDVTAVPDDLPPPTFAVTPETWPLTALYGWPYAIGGVLAHVAGAEPRAAPAFAGLGDAVLVVPAFGPDLAHTAAVAEIAADPGAAAPVRAFVDAVWGAATSAGGVRRWGAGPLRAFARTRGGAATFGLASGAGAATDAYLARARRAPPPPAGTVAELRARPAALALVHPLAGLLGALTATARFDGALHVDATFDAP